MSGLKKSIKLKNRKIAEFMGLHSITLGGRIYYVDNKPKSMAIDIESLNYHEDWNKLKPVFDKILEICDLLKINDNTREGLCLMNICIEKISDTYSIDILWNDILNFIDWYNNYMKEYES